jgi:hypothetical protein
MSTNKVNPELLEVAERCQKVALQKGASEAAARAYKVRDVSVQWRDGKIEQINEATTRGVGLQLYVDGRYSAVSSSDLRPAAVETFIGDAVTMTRSLAKDPFRSLPDPPRTGDNMLEVTVKGASGQPIPDADVSVTFFMAAMPTMNMPAMRSEATLEHVGNGRYQGTGQLSMGGTWNVAITASRGAEQLGTRRLSIVAKE